jgi:hypothetical protein
MEGPNETLKYFESIFYAYIKRLFFKQNFIWDSFSGIFLHAWTQVG